MDDVRFIQDARELKALAHPLRTQMLAALRHYGPATATQLAERFDESTGVTSYHLRQLAKHGFVDEDTERGKGRERWWRAVHRGTAWRTTDIEHDPLGREASTWMQRRQVQLLTRRMESFIGRQFDLDKAWRAASELSDYQLRLSPAALEALTRELHEVVRRHWAAAEAAPPAPDTGNVFLGLVAVPVEADPLEQR
jgi:DNA-binding transcriptional ArsR family regulator